MAAWRVALPAMRGVTGSAARASVKSFSTWAHTSALLELAGRSVASEGCRISGTLPYRFARLKYSSPRMNLASPTSWSLRAGSIWMPGMLAITWLARKIAW